eukprot:scaffold7052_cov254-Pinguiococcus_pyrenoidosus.AAC.51
MARWKFRWTSRESADEPSLRCREQIIYTGRHQYRVSGPMGAFSLALTATQGLYESYATGAAHAPSEAAWLVNVRPSFASAVPPQSARIYVQVL